MRLFWLLTLLIAATGTALAKDACSLLTSDDLQSTLGQSFHQVPNGMIPPSAPGLQYSECTFETVRGGPRVSLLARYSTTRDNDSTSELMAKLRRQGFKDVREVSGVGDGAVWAIMTISAKSNTCQLTFMKGKRTFLLVTIGHAPDPAAAFEQAKALANRIVPRA
jgi:hypothetical protein